MTDLLKLLPSLQGLTEQDILSEITRRKYTKIESYFPETGPLRRELYTKHMEFFESTALYRETGLIAANRVGKTEGCGGYAVTGWLTGDYPVWWNGKRFNKPVSGLVCGETGKLVRDSTQLKLLGPPNAIGTGLIPANRIARIRPKSGIPDAVDTVQVKHRSGGESILQFQSYDQGREAFQATERDFVWEDEEPPLDIHTENLIRTMTTNGVVISTFTPLKGVSDTVLSLQEKKEKGTASLITATWDDAPHLTEAAKQQLWDALPPYQRDARSKGIPQLGSGAIYPIAETDILVDPFEIPKHWFRCYGLDVGWNNTAAAWLAHDRETDTVYLVDDYKRGQAEPAVHSSAIRARGAWIPGAIDPASRGRAQADGSQLIQLYTDNGLILTHADNAVEAGIFDVYERMTTGRFKVFRSCSHFIGEFRLYRRDEKGRIVKQNDHVMDAVRYAVRTGLSIAIQPSFAEKEPTHYAYRYPAGGQSWMS
jgi:phage terminase large subunit-like protein